MSILVPAVLGLLLLSFYSSAVCGMIGSDRYYIYLPKYFINGDHMRIFIDADGCPVVDITVSVAAKNNVECIIICDTSHIINKEGTRTITVEKGADSVDFALVNMVKPGDIVITQDYGLAAMCLARKAIPINQDGLVYTENNIDQLLFSRYLSKKIRNAGGRVKGPPKRNSGQDDSFKAALTTLIHSC